MSCMRGHGRFRNLAPRRGCLLLWIMLKTKSCNCIGCTSVREIATSTIKMMPERWRLTTIDNVPWRLFLGTIDLLWKDLPPRVSQESDSDSDEDESGASQDYFRLRCLRSRIRCGTTSSHLASDSLGHICMPQEPGAQKDDTENSSIETCMNNWLKYFFNAIHRSWSLPNTEDWFLDVCLVHCSKCVLCETCGKHLSTYHVARVSVLTHVLRWGNALGVYK